MSDASLRITVGASLNANVATVFASIEKRAQQARKNIQTSLGGVDLAGPYRTSAKKAEESIGGIGASAKKTAKTIHGAAAIEAAQSFKALAASAKKLSPELAAVAREAERELKKIETAAARTALGLKSVGKGNNWKSGGGGAIGVGRRAGVRVSRGAALGYGYAGAAISAGASAVNSFLTGSGVDTDFASNVAKNEEQKKLSRQISNSGYLPGTQGANGQVQDSGAILEQARTVGGATGIDTKEALDGLREFVSQTGDLELGRNLLADMAKLSRATGSNLADMSAASANVANSLGDVPDKANVVNTVMRQVAGQGKLGAIEIRDLASQMAKLAAASHSFEGGVAKNIGVMGVIAQESRLRGGSASATQAATSVTAFASDVTKNAKKWKKNYGMTPFTDDSETSLVSPDKIIKMALKKADTTGKGANLETLSGMFSNKRSMAAVKGFADIYNTAGGGNEGMKAVDEEFKRLASAQLSAEEVTRAFSVSMAGADTDANRANIALTKMAGNISDSLMPALVGLAPAVTALTPLISGVVEKFASFLTGEAPIKDPVTGKKISLDDDAKNIAARNAQADALRLEATTALGSHAGALQGDALLAPGEAAYRPPGLLAGTSLDADKTPTIDAGHLAEVSKTGAAYATAIQEAETNLKADIANAKTLRGGGMADGKFGGAMSQSELKEYDTKVTKDKINLAQLHTAAEATNTALALIHSALTSGSLLVKVTNLPKGGGLGTGVQPANTPKPSE